MFSTCLDVECSPGRRTTEDGLSSYPVRLQARREKAHVMQFVMSVEPFITQFRSLDDSVFRILLCSILFATLNIDT